MWLRKWHCMRGTCTPRRCSKARHITKQRQLQHVGVPPPRLWTLLLQLQHARSCKSEDSFWPRATSRAAGQSSLNCRQWCTDTLHQSAVSAGSATALQIRRFAVPQPRCISLARPHADCNTTTMTSHGDWLRNDLPSESRMLACVLLAHHAQHVAQRSPSPSIQMHGLAQTYFRTFRPPVTASSCKGCAPLHCRELLISKHADVEEHDDADLHRTAKSMAAFITSA